MTFTRFAICIATATTLGLAGCAEMFPGKAATGVARLTVRNVGTLLSLAAGDTNCGFESPQVLANVKADAPVGSIGTVTWTVTNCTLDYGSGQEVARDCNGASTDASGSVTVTAEKSVEGYVTGDPDSPVVPTGPYSATITLVEASFDNFRVGTSVSPNALTIESGTVSAVMTPKLASSGSVCEIATKVTRFDSIRYRDASLQVEASTNFGVMVSESDLWAQNGPDGASENELGGTVTMFGGPKEVALDGDGLDPDYTPEMFLGSFACDEDLVWPVSYECNLNEALSLAAARLSVRTLASVVSIASDDPACGFDSASAQTTTEGTLGDPGGVAVTRIDGCTVSFPQPTVLKTDCQGVETIVQGSLTITGTKSISGIITGDPESAAIPTSRDAAVVNVTADLSDFKVSVSNDTKALSATGTLTGSLMPRLAIDTVTGACSKLTSVAEFTGLGWSDTRLTVHSGTKDLGLSVSDANINALNGIKDERANSVSGNMTVDGIANSFDDLLVSEFDPVAFDAAYQCDVDMVVPTDDAACDFSEVLAQGAARLIVKTFGNVLKATDLNESCGFSSIDETLPGGISAIPGEDVNAVWDVANCTVGGGDAYLMSTDCNGTETWIHGTAVVSASKHAAGELAVGFPPILPRSRTSARVDLHNATLTNFAVVEYEAGATEPSSHMEVHSASLTGTSYPVTGEATDSPGAFFVPTPVAGFDNVQLSNAQVTLVTDNKRFNLTVDFSQLDAFNGTFNGQSNSLDGTITVGGRTLEVPVDPADGGLNPDYDQAQFDASYVCYDNLAGVIVE